MSPMVATEVVAWPAFADAVLCRAAMQRTQLGTQLGAAADAAELDRLLDDLPTVAAALAPDERASRELELAALTEQVERHRARLGSDGSQLAQLAEVIGADDVEREILALAVAVAASPARLACLRWIAGGRQVAGIELGLLAPLLGRDDVWSSVGVDSLLVRHGLLDVIDPEAGGSAVLRAPAAVMSFVLGSPSDDARSPVSAVWHPGPARATPGRWAIHGPDRVLRLRAAAEAVGSTRHVTVLDLDEGEDWLPLIRLATVTGSAIVVEADAEISPHTRRHMVRADRLAWVLSTKHPLPLHELPVGGVVEIEADEQPVAPDEIEAVLGEPAAGQPVHHEQLELLQRVAAVDGRRSLRRLAAGELNRLAQRIRPTRTWDDLVLNDDQLAKVREIAHRVQHRDRVYGEWGFRRSPATGVVALFTGPPGTGKTISAEVIAGELGVDVFRIELTSIVSKYIGETEKQLERVFEAAEIAGVVLLFDEADAVFGKRTAVSDANDRYANLETSYLLQRIERYEGVTVLTSNLAKNIDEAFLRRIHVSVDFPMPDEAERRRIWASCFPPEAPLGDVDVDDLAARFRVAGGSIRSAVQTAAFAAAEEDSPIAMRHVVHGLRREFQKMGRLITDEDFGGAHPAR
jgi:ATP-dependent 26S proteasome regulatory subunit